MSRKFNALANKVSRSYQKKGMSKKRAAYVGKATAGKVYREQQRRKARSRKRR